MAHLLMPGRDKPARGGYMMTKLYAFIATPRVSLRGIICTLARMSKEDDGCTATTASPWLCHEDIIDLQTMPSSLKRKLRNGGLYVIRRQTALAHGPDGWRSAKLESNIAPQIPQHVREAIIPCPSTSYCKRMRLLTGRSSCSRQLPSRAICTLVGYDKIFSSS